MLCAALSAVLSKEKVPKSASGSPGGGYAWELHLEYAREARRIKSLIRPEECLLTGGSAGGGGGAHLRHEARLPQVPCRFDFALFARQYFNCTGNAAEIGVFQGNFSGHNLKFWAGHYYAIDYWNYRPWDAAHGTHSSNDKNFKRQEEWDDHYEFARQAMAFAGDRVHQIRNTSVGAASLFTDHFFDWLFIDALHTEPAVKQDLNAWWPKLRPGGLLSGDDYGGTEHNNPLITVERWIRNFGGGSHCCRWGVIKAVHDFAKENGVVVHTTYTYDCYSAPGWYIVKPLCWPNC